MPPAGRRLAAMTRSYKIECPEGELSPSLISEEDAHNWAARNRRGKDYVVHVLPDGEHDAEQHHFAPRPS